MRIFHVLCSERAASFRSGRRRRVMQLGAKVIVPPFDAPWSRLGYFRVHLAIIDDPQGATFIPSKFVPENNGPNM
jgi:hypothetical protein